MTKDTLLAQLQLSPINLNRSHFLGQGKMEEVEWGWLVGSRGGGFVVEMDMKTKRMPFSWKFVFNMGVSLMNAGML